MSGNARVKRRPGPALVEDTADDWKCTNWRRCVSREQLDALAAELVVFHRAAAVVLVQHPKHPPNLYIELRSNEPEGAVHRRLQQLLAECSGFTYSIVARADAVHL